MAVGTLLGFERLRSLLEEVDCGILSDAFSDILSCIPLAFYLTYSLRSPQRHRDRVRVQEPAEEETRMSTEGRRKEEQEGRRREGATPSLETRGPHLADGGEKMRMI